MGVGGDHTTGPSGPLDRRAHGSHGGKAPEVRDTATACLKKTDNAAKNDEPRVHLQPGQ